MVFQDQGIVVADEGSQYGNKYGDAPLIQEEAQFMHSTSMDINCSNDRWYIWLCAICLIFIQGFTLNVLLHKNFRNTFTNSA